VAAQLERVPEGWRLIGGRARLWSARVLSDAIETFTLDDVAGRGTPARHLETSAP